MAKMFYSLEEAADRLGKSSDEVKQMASSGQLQEFRDRDRLMFKREQVDLLAGDPGASKGGSGVLPLADSAGNSGIGLQLEDSAGGSGAIDLDGPPAGKPNERSGISIFDTESTEEGDPSAVTRITETATAGELTLESVGSGSGLLDLTREADDTSLGADLLEDVYKPDDEGGGGALFESTAAPSDVAAAAAAAGMPAMGLVAAEPYDGTASGWGGGLALAATLVTAIALVSTLMGLMGADNPLAGLFDGNVLVWVGIFAGLMLVCAVIGLLLGKRS